ncbi:hypothetical protein [Streptomyces tsukubensis]|uniref:hypothetical protein n=1 Tax=Streptomyces tsukubensis TaxID=83656 RepID=UPI003450E64E
MAKHIRNHDTFSGTREEVVTELEARATGWHFMASDRKRDRAAEAAESVRDGADSVKVGHTVFAVTDDAVPGQRIESGETADNIVS